MLGVVVQVHPYGPGAGERGCRVRRVGAGFSPRRVGPGNWKYEKLTSRPATLPTRIPDFQVFTYPRHLPTGPGRERLGLGVS
jgi:hypothetical protein